MWVASIAIIPHNNFFSLQYAIVVLIIVIVEIAAGAAAFYFRNELAGLLQEGIEENLIANYDFTDPASPRNDLVDFFQGTVSECTNHNTL